MIVNDRADMKLEVRKIGNGGFDALVVDDFFRDPDQVREDALALPFEKPRHPYPGLVAEPAWDFASVAAVGDLNGEPGLELILTDGAAHRMKALSSQWIGKPMAFLINDEVVLAPIVRAVLGERLIVQGRFTMEELERLATNFR